MSSTTALPQANKTLDQACPIQRTPGIIQLPPNRSLNKSKNKSKRNAATRNDAKAAAPVPAPEPESNLTWQQQLFNNPKRPGPKFDHAAEKRDEETFGATKDKRKGRKDNAQHVREKKGPHTPERVDKYAGPTFHNSPAPDTLPAPRFQSRSSKLAQGDAPGDVSNTSITTSAPNSPSTAVQRAAESSAAAPPPAAQAAVPPAAVPPAASPSAPAVSPAIPPPPMMPQHLAMHPHPLSASPHAIRTPFVPPGYYGAYAPQSGMMPMMPPHAMPYPMPVGFRPHMVPPYAAAPMPGMPMNMPVPPSAPPHPPAPAPVAAPSPSPAAPAARGGQTVDNLLANMLGASAQPRAL